MLNESVRDQRIRPYTTKVHSLNLISYVVCEYEGEIQWEVSIQF